MELLETKWIKSIGTCAAHGEDLFWVTLHRCIYPGNVTPHERMLQAHGCCDDQGAFAVSLIPKGNVGPWLTKTASDCCQPCAWTDRQERAQGDEA